ncbi:hypothetical protein LOTGIDRAFT_119019 [Lottia gigantea]|uniref:EF-hand domain-containing protein n=1 Tax=Lottia gigantea TaxID=225164 RepID=V4A9U8_LOTGI|nr:hypothetical protein LOTGIDRAFT_119019 [Lottia gigantea]ESO93527.1 hypothetical protein LOTGIDRAFT_119019 [Lottia gigantea]
MVLFTLLCCLFIIGRHDPTQIPEEIVINIGDDGVLLFQQHDRDNDGYLSIQEFEPLVYRLLEINVSGPVYDVPISTDDEMITLKSYFIPIVKESMSKDLNDSVSIGLLRTMNSLHGLEKWQNVNLQWMNFGASHFSGFLPKDVDSIMLGSSYFIINVEKGLFNAALSSNRYYPPKVTTNESIIVHRLLTLFHPRPFVVSRFPAQSSVACVRAYNDKYLDIVFRIHAEFQLNEPPYHPFWFTPAQFTGNLIISKDGKHIQYFNLYVPNNKRLNIDMEWLNGPNESENMEVDIGFMPLMQLNSTQSSVPVKNLEEYELLEPLPERPQHKTEGENIEWMATIDLEDAKSSLEKALYPFKKVPYYNFTEAFKKAEDNKKLVHSILLWGALDDQSC